MCNIRIVCLASGGIDSSIMMLLLKKRGHDIFSLFVNYGQLAYKYEWNAYQNICRYLDLEPQQIDVSEVGSVIQSGITSRSHHIEKDAFLPNRNLILLTLGASYGFTKSAYVISIGLLSNSIFPDQTRDFINKTQDTLSSSLNADIRIMTPLISLDKVDILKLVRKHRFPLELTYYCHAGKKNPCEKCISCLENKAAMQIIDQRR